MGLGQQKAADEMEENDYYILKSTFCTIWDLILRPQLGASQYRSELHTKWEWRVASQYD